MCPQSLWLQGRIWRELTRFQCFCLRAWIWRSLISLQNFHVQARFCRWCGRVSGGEQQETDAKENHYDGRSGGPESHEMGRRAEPILGYSGLSLNRQIKQCDLSRQHGRARLVNAKDAVLVAFDELHVE